jgi:enhancing lycopene biosynthesis protein 2
MVKEIVAAGKPLAAVCIAPALLAKVLGPINSPALTIGTDEGTAAALTAMGAKHVDCPVKETIVDKENKIVSSPAYMLAGSISEAADGIEKTVEELIAMIE